MEEEKQSLPQASKTRAALQLLHHRQLRESLALAPQMSLRIALIAGLQASLAVLVALVSTLMSPWPELVGFPALGALAALFGRFAPLARRRRIVAVCAMLLLFAVLLPGMASLLGASEWGLVLVLALVAGASTVAVSRWDLGGPGAVIIVFAAGAALHPVGSWQELAVRLAATAAGGLIGWLVCWLTDGLRAKELRQLRFPATRIPPPSHQWIAGARIAAGAAVAALLAWAAGAAHPAWAAIGATAVMQGGHLHVTMNRALQRMAGTVLGACLVWLILAQHPPLWGIVLAIVAFQFLTEVIIGFNYALGQITVTPMALLMTLLASQSALLGSMPVERVLDTVLGAAVGIALAVLFSSADDRAYLAALRRRA
ncbi:FUSC family protein [Comamonas endophytica]|uniref:FUSC family protein n=1 Tax=Comamonas endophytica TaxID=2949090 RepID=A0ABY6GBS2_9BURK|nr:MULTISPECIES: FUSC family protein [unclassified Acidovorax]MCD2513470.1 FUSC family protein [Acidovorax sp. D4N7]UYG52514.1 FUSC family protein [Acidovorax sp. 5MLIR]